MSWAYFTAYLDGTRPITKAERDELADQLAAKLTFPCGRFGLDATRQTAIRASLLATDLIGVRDGVSTFAQGLYTAITSTYAVAFGGSSAVLAAQTTALAAEGITDTQLAAIRTSAADHFRLWNFYKRFIDALVPTIASSTGYSRSVSASKSKVGYVEFDGPSSPPRIYLRTTASGSVTLASFSAADCSSGCYYKRITTTNGQVDFDPDTMLESYSGTWQVAEDTDSDCVVDLTTPFDPTGGALGGDGDTATVTLTTLVTSGSGVCNSGNLFTGSNTFTRTNEYTTALLNTKVDADLTLPGSFSAGLSTLGYRELTTDEIDLAKTKSEYKFALPSLVALGYVTYRLDWIERFSPLGGGAPTDTAKFYNWDGVATETPVYAVAPPATNGTVTVIGLTASC